MGILKIMKLISINDVIIIYVYSPKLKLGILFNWPNSAFDLLQTLNEWQANMLIPIFWEKVGVRN